MYLLCSNKHNIFYDFNIIIVSNAFSLPKNYVSCNFSPWEHSLSDSASKVTEERFGFKKRDWVSKREIGFQKERLGFKKKDWVSKRKIGFAFVGHCNLYLFRLIVLCYI